MVPPNEIFLNNPSWVCSVCKNTVRLRRVIIHVDEFCVDADMAKASAYVGQNLLPVKHVVATNVRAFYSGVIIAGNMGGCLGTTLGLVMRWTPTATMNRIRNPHPFP